MSMTQSLSDKAITRGIKAVGVGKKGSKALEVSLIHEITDDLKSGKVSLLEQGAFFGALWIKGLTPEERSLEKVLGNGAFVSAKILGKILCADAPDDIQKMAIALLESKTLDIATAHRLGKFLLSDEPGEGARGLAVSILRVRYETDDEYEGLLKSFQESLEPNFRSAVPAGEPIIQLAEPFDGADHSYLMTPLLARYLQTLNYRTISLVGRNSGPKFGNNLLSLVEALKIPCVKSNADIKSLKPTFGWYFNQQDMSKAMDRWVDRRHKTVKRPCFATLEKFLNPADAKIIIASAFHPPYGEKMTTVAERAGFQGSIVIRNGLEGTMAFPLKREVKILCSAKTSAGYKRHEIIFDPAAFLNKEIPLEEVLENPSLAENVRLIQTFAQKGVTENELFNLRVRATCHGINLGLQWIERPAGRQAGRAV